MDILESVVFESFYEIAGEDKTMFLQEYKKRVMEKYIPVMSIHFLKIFLELYLG